MAGVGAALEQSLAHASQEDSELKACIALSLVSRSLLLLLLLRLAFLFFLSLAWLVGWLIGWLLLFVSLWIVSIMSSQRELDRALLVAADQGKLEEIRSLLDRGANINAVDTIKNTPLHRASRNGHHQCVELLLDRGANINAVDASNDTPLHSASIYGHHQCIELLIDRGADKSIKEVREDGRDSLLHLLLILTISHPIHSIISATAIPQNKLPEHERLLNLFEIEVS